MIDINNIVNTAIQQEINKAITNYVDAYMANVQQEHRRQIDALKVEIEQLKAQRADSPATGLSEMQSRPRVDFITDVMTILKEHAGAREAIQEIAKPNFTGQEVTALQLCITHETSPVYNAIVKIARDVAVATAEEVMDCHTEEYDHDRYDSAASAIEDANLDSLPDFDDFVKHDDLPDFDAFVKEDQMCDAIEEKINDLVDVDTLVTKDDLFDAVREAVRDTVENRVSVSLHLS